MSESEKDREHISGLPDALIVQILSLVPIEDAVRTSVLSRRWQYSENMLHVTVFAPLGWKVYSEDFDPRSFRRTHDFSGDFNLCFENRNITCLSQNLKLVKVVDFSKTCLRAELLGKNYEYALVEYLLKNARVLEAVIITFGQKECNICCANCMSQFLPLLAGRLVDAPKASPAATVMLYPPPV